MTLHLTLDLASFLQESRSYVMPVFQEFDKRATIPAVKSKLYVCANMFAIINSLDMLKDDRLKNYHPLGVPLPLYYTIELY